VTDPKFYTPNIGCTDGCPDFRWPPEGEPDSDRRSASHTAPNDSGCMVGNPYLIALRQSCP
jgi:hypothetical protein